VNLPGRSPDRLGWRTSGELAGRRPSTLLVPLGATEQHGPHLPLGTDTILALAWAEGVARRLAGAVVAPVLPYGSSGEHQGFPGTLSIGGPALELVVVELARSAASTFDRTVFLSGHGGNAEPLDRAVGRLRAEGHDVARLVPTWPGRDVDAHAGRTETSLMLHLRPELVGPARAAGDTRPLVEILPALRSGGVAAVSANGVLGDPTGADAADGRALLDDLIERTLATLARPDRR
jgi:creatinine amidohydrolase